MTIDKETRAEILRLYHVEKWTVGTITRQLGVHRYTVERLLTAAGEPRDARSPRPSMIDPYVPFIAETLASWPTLPASRLYQMVRERGYRRDPTDAARWRRPGSVVSINGFMFYEHLRGEGGGGAIDLVIHACRCTVPEALGFFSELPCRDRFPADRHPKPPCPDRHWPAIQSYLVEQRGLADVLVALCRDLGLLYADRHGNAVFVRRNAAGEALGAEIVPAAAPRRLAPTGAAARGGFWMSWEPDWPNSVILAKNAIDALSVLSLHLVPAGRKGCAVVSTGGATASLPEWIEAWNPGRIFCAYDATRQGDDAAARLIRNDSRVVRLRPALDGLGWNDMLMRDRAGEPLQIDDRPLD